MLSFIEYLLEAKAEQAAAEPKKQNIRGVLHELLVGKHLNGGKHMQKHPDSPGESPEEAHHRIATKLYGSGYKDHPDYNEAVAKAKHTAEHLKKSSGPISKVHWASKPGDVERITGSKSSQSDDSSDLYIEHPKKKFTGISLKTVEKKNGSAPVSNSGRKAEDKKLGVNTDSIINKSTKNLRSKFKSLKSATTTAQAKEAIKSDPKLKAAESEERSKALSQVAATHAQAYNSMSHPERAKHLRTMMRANPTGHRHLRVTTGGSGGDFSVKTEEPDTQHDHILKSPQHITAEASGNSVIFKHKGKAFFSHRMKAEGSAGLFGSIKTSGELK